MRKLISGLMAAAFIAVSVLATTQAVQAWGEAEYTANGAPQFNTYTGVPNLGDEHDFFRVGPANATSANQMTNLYEVCNGEARFTTYIHNGAPEAYNGTNNDGTGVAKDVKLNIKLPTGSAKVQNAEAVISASNAATVSDGATIKCGDHDVKLSYVVDSATVFSQKRGEQKLSNAVVNGGTLIGTYKDDGVVPGCWDYRVYVSVIVKVTPVTPPTPPVTPPVTPVTPTTPSELPKTGAGNVMGIVAAVTVAGALTHRLVLSRRNG